MVPRPPPVRLSRLVTISLVAWLMPMVAIPKYAPRRRSTALPKRAAYSPANTPAAKSATKKPALYLTIRTATVYAPTPKKAMLPRAG